MTTYSAVTAGEVDSDSPVTDTLMGKLAGNPLAIAEADASVPATLLPTVLLGTLTTTSGSTQTLSSLTLTPYKLLLFVANGVSTTTSGSNVTVASVSIGSTASAATLLFATVIVDLGSGAGASSAGDGAATGLSTASTSVSASTSAGTFDAGTIRVYGLK